MLGPFTTASRLTPIHQVSPAVLSLAACASMSTTPTTTTTTTTTTTRDRGDRYDPMEWAQLRVAKIIGQSAAFLLCDSPAALYWFRPVSDDTRGEQKLDELVVKGVQVARLLF